jgi:resuscitation-promoting factor RpfB
MERDTLTLHRPNPVQRLLSHGLFALGTMAAMVIAMVLGYNAALGSITITIDGQARVVHTNQRLVDNVLREAGVTLQPEDLVAPDLEATLPDRQATITVQRARSITLVADDHTQQFRTQATTLPDLFKQAKVPLGEHDRVTINGQVFNHSDNAAQLAAPGSTDRSPLAIAVRRALSVTIDTGNNNLRQIETPAATVGQALTEADVQLYLADRITPDLATPLTPGLRIQIEASMPIQVEVDGQLIRSRTLRHKVGEVLSDLGVALFGQDYTQPALEADIKADTAIRVVRVREEYKIQQEPILFETETVYDPDVELDTSSTQEGQNGLRQKRIRVRYEDGQEVTRSLVDEFVLEPAVNKITRLGTKVVIRTLDTPSGPIEYWRHLRMYATAYSASTSGTSPTAPWYGFTATGSKMQKGVIAVDPKVVPLRTQIYVADYGIGAALDTGSGVKGRWLDLGYDDDNLVGWHWWVDAYLLTPVPANIPYNIPNWPTYKGR